MQITNCARRKSRQVAFGQGFDSPRLHHSRPPFDANQVVVLLLSHRYRYTHGHLSYQKHLLAPQKRKTTSCTPQWVCPHKCRHQFRKLPSAHLLHRYRFSVPASVAQISHCEAIYRFPRRGKYHGCFFLVALKRNKPMVSLNNETISKGLKSSVQLIYSHMFYIIYRNGKFGRGI